MTFQLSCLITRGYSLVPTGSLEVSRLSLVVQPLMVKAKDSFFFRKRRSEKSPCSHQTSLELDFNQRQLIVQNSFNPGFYFFFSVRSSSIKKRLQAIKESQLIAMAGSSPIESHDYVGLEPSGMRDRKPHRSSGSSMKRGGSFYEAFDLEMVQNVPQLRP